MPKIGLTAWCGRGALRNFSKAVGVPAKELADVGGRGGAFVSNLVEKLHIRGNATGLVVGSGHAALVGEVDGRKFWRGVLERPEEVDWIEHEDPRVERKNERRARALKRALRACKRP